MPRTAARFCQADIARALRAVKQVDARAVVKLLPDGTIEITPDDTHGENPQLVKERLADGREAVL